MIAEISILAFWSTFFGILSAKKICFQRADTTLERLERLVSKKSDLTSNLLISAKRTRHTERLRQKLILAGLHRKRDLEWALRLQYLCQMIPIAMMLVLFFMGFPLPQILFLGILFVLIFMLLPRVIILKKIIKRRQEIERHLPSTIDLLTLCLEAGLSFDTSLIRVAEEQRRVSSQISREFTFTNQEILAGKSRKEALKNLAWRAGVEEMRALVGAILQSIKLGSNLVQTLRTQAAAARKKRREVIRAIILKTPVKLIFPLLFFIFPTLLMIVLGPSFINIFRHLNEVGY